MSWGVGSTALLFFATTVQILSSSVSSHRCQTLQFAQCADGCSDIGTTSYVALLPKCFWWQRMSKLCLCNWRSGSHPCACVTFLVFWRKKPQTPTFMPVIDYLCYRKCLAECALISRKCSYVVFLWECKLLIPSLNTTWPTVLFCKASRGQLLTSSSQLWHESSTLAAVPLKWVGFQSIFSGRRGEEGSSPLFSGNLCLALGRCQAMWCEC